MRSILAILRRLATLSLGDYLLLGETLIAVTVASLAIRLLPFRIVVALAQLPLSAPSPTPESRRASRARIRWSVSACARRLPWHPMCFPQGLAAQWLLRRRGIPSILHYGAAPDPVKGVIAHVWVCDDDIAVVGGAAAQGMALLARFPAQDSSS